MAKNFHTDNKAFMLYKDWEDIFQALDSSEEIGELVMALFAYAKRGETPKLSGGAKIAFLMMRAAIERDGIAWEEMCAQRSECGKKGGRPKKSDESGNTDEKAEQSAASADNAEENPCYHSASRVRSSRMRYIRAARCVPSKPYQDEQPLQRIAPCQTCHTLKQTELCFRQSTKERKCP